VIVVQKNDDDTHVVARHLASLLLQRPDLAVLRRVYIHLIVNLDELEGVHLLRLLVLLDFEVGRGQIHHGPALFVGDDDVHADGVDSTDKGGPLGVLRGRILAGGCGGHR